MARRPHYYAPIALQIERCDTTGNKIIYPNKVEAENAADLTSLQRGVKTYAYLDPTCNHWHLTKLDPNSSY